MIASERLKIIVEAGPAMTVDELRRAIDGARRQSRIRVAGATVGFLDDVERVCAWAESMIDVTAKVQSAVVVP